MGLGDLKFLAALSFIFGWPDILMILFLSFIIGSVFVLPLLIKKKKTMKDVVPFGPFLIGGWLLAYFWAEKIINLYLNFLTK